MEGSEYNDSSDERGRRNREVDEYKEAEEDEETPEETMERKFRELRRKWEEDEDPEERMKRAAREVKEKWEREEQAEEIMEKAAKELRDKWKEEEESETEKHEKPKHSKETDEEEENEKNERNQTDQESSEIEKQEEDKELERYAADEKPEQSIKDAVKELEEEEEERRRFRERSKEWEEGQEERDEQSVKAAVKELEEREADYQRFREESKEYAERKEEREEQAVKDAVRELAEEEAEMQRIKERMDELEEGREEREEQRIKDAIKEVAEEDAELQRLQDQLDEMRRAKEERLERDREERAECADKDKLDQFEKDILDNFEKYGYDEEKVRELWKRRFEDDIEDELKEEDEASEKTEKEEEGDEKKSKTAEGYSTYQDGSGMAYAVKNESKESAEAASKKEVEETTEKEHDEQTRTDTEGKTPEKKITRPEQEIEEKPDAESSEVESEKKTKKKEIAETSESEEVEGQSKTKTRKEGHSESVDEIEEPVTQETNPGESQESAEKEDSEHSEVEPETRPMKEVSEGKKEEQPSESAENTQTDDETNNEGSGSVDESYERSEVEDNRQVSNESTGENTGFAAQEDSKESESTKSDPAIEEGVKEGSETKDDAESEEVEEQGVVYRPTRTFRSLGENPREKEWTKYIESIFENLSEEDKEEFRKRIRGKLKTKEDFERLLRELGLEWRAEPENVEKANKFLKFIREIEERGIEELEKIAEEFEIEEDVARKWANGKSRPSLINAILHRLSEQEWSLLVRLKMYLSTPRSMEEVHEIVKQNPELRELPYFEQMMKDVKAWIEIMNMKKEGMLDIITDKHGNEKFLLKEIRDLSMKYGVSESEILDWLRERTRPPLVGHIAKKIVPRKNEEILKLLDSQDSFDRALVRYPEVRLKKTFKKKYHEVTSFYVLQDMLKNGEVNLRSFSQKWKIPYDKVSEWARNKSRPNLLEVIHGFEVRRLYEEVHGGLPIIKIESMIDVKRLLKIHPSSQKGSDDVYEKYFAVINNPNMTLKDLSKTFGVSPSQASKWRTRKEPFRIAFLRRMEEERIINNWFGGTNLRSIYRFLSENSTRTNAIRSIDNLSRSIIRYSLAKPGKNWTLDDIVAAIEDLCKNHPESDGRVFFADFLDKTKLPLEEIERMEKIITLNQDSLEHALKQKLGFEDNRALQIAIVDGGLFIWTPNLSPFNLMNAYRREYFYFNNRRDMAGLISQLNKTLGISDNKGLSDTLDYIEKLLSKMFGENNVYPLRNKEPRYRILGNHLHFLLDLTGQTSRSLEGRISKIACETGVGGIDNPKFPEKEELAIVLARLVATMICDGSINYNGQVRYFEANIERVNRVRNNLHHFGKMEFRVYLKNGLYECYFPKIIGSILNECGVSSRDKIILNPKINPNFIRGLSWNALLAFIEDLIPEDGFFMPGRVSVTHSVSLHPGDKLDKYNVTPLVGKSTMRLIMKHGNKEGSSWRLPFGKLRKIMDDGPTDDAIIAKKLREIVYANPNAFIMDEKEIFRRIGIKAKERPISVFFHGKSGSITVSWRLTTTGKDEAIKFAILAPANDVIKREKMKNWLKSIPDEVVRIFKQLLENGSKPKRWWDE